ncbi:hypothetical protein OHB54_01185 [Streptomyces sp. NBC_01007]|nr:hypothetical protein OHB54_01185 [Streptomyces sp. NBC_01007]
MNHIIDWEEADVEELLAWVSRYAADRGWSCTVHTSVPDGDGSGLIRLAGTLGAPFADA